MSPERTSLTIRGHHLLCMLGFRGRGYSQEFTSNMAAVVESIRRDGQRVLTLTDCCDDICAACPHNRDGRCRKTASAEHSVCRKDRLVLSRLGLSAGQSMSAREVFAVLAARMSVADLEQNTCPRCQWLPLGFCREGLGGLGRGEFFRNA